jgi:hypothetical protein
LPPISTATSSCCAGVNPLARTEPRDAIVAVQVIVADEGRHGGGAGAAVEVWGVELENGQRVTVGSEAQAAAFARQAGSRPTRIARRESSLLFGTPEQVKAQLDALQAAWNIDEFIDTPISDGRRACTPCACWRRRIWRGGAAMSLEQQLISWRRELHQNPELSLQEVAPPRGSATGCRAAASPCCPTI